MDTNSIYSLLIINFDEHGGFADHVPPPMNIPAPKDGMTFNGTSDGHVVQYDFTRLGVRYVILSPDTNSNTNGA
jgi:phospholipase C